MSKQEGNALVRGKDIKGTVVVLSKTQPQQLSLFQTFLPADERYSNTIDLYDAIPKYFPKKRLKKERVEGMFLPMLKREFEFKGERFVVKITPAKLETREGERDFYPSHCGPAWLHRSALWSLSSLGFLFDAPTQCR